MRAYLIEPQTIFMPYLTAVLRGGGIDVVATAEDVDGHDIVANAPDAIFVDIDFFDRGGPSTLCRIREIARRATIIAISESDDPTFEASCYISGANAVVAKSNAPETFLRKIRNLGPLPPAWPVAAAAATTMRGDDSRTEVLERR